MSEIDSITPQNSSTPDYHSSDKTVTSYKPVSKQGTNTNMDSSLDRTLESDRRPFSKTAGNTDDSADDEMSNTASPVYTETWEEDSPRKTALGSQLTYRSKESGRLSPTMATASVEVGRQPLTLPRFNETLKIKKGRHFVDYEAPAPTVVYVPHRRFAHGPWSNVAVEKKNGRYVVIEQRPVHTEFSDMLPQVRQAYERDLFGPDKSWTKKKSPWSWSTKGEFIERSVNKDFYEPYLPPMKPRYSHIDSKVGSLENSSHQPGGGMHKVPSFKLNWKAEAKIGSLPVTSGSHDFSPDSSLKLPSISPRYGASAASGAFTSIHYTPGGNVILKKRFDAKSVVGSLDNISHTPSGGSIHIPKNKIKWKKESVVGSLDNVTHLPKSSNVQVFNEKLDWKTDSKIGSMDNIGHSPRRKAFKVPHFSSDWNKKANSKLHSLRNVHHSPGGGNVQIIDEKLKWNAKPKIDNHWKFNYDYKSLFDDDDHNMPNFSPSSSHPFTV